MIKKDDIVSTNIVMLYLSLIIANFYATSIFWQDEYKDYSLISLAIGIFYCGGIIVICCGNKFYRNGHVLLISVLNSIFSLPSFILYLIYYSGEEKRSDILLLLLMSIPGVLMFILNLIWYISYMSDHTECSVGSSDQLSYVHNPGGISYHTTE